MRPLLWGSLLTAAVWLHQASCQVGPTSTAKYRTGPSGTPAEYCGVQAPALSPSSAHLNSSVLVVGVITSSQVGCPQQRASDAPARVQLQASMATSSQWPNTAVCAFVGWPSIQALFNTSVSRQLNCGLAGHSRQPVAAVAAPGLTDSCVLAGSVLGRQGVHAEESGCNPAATSALCSSQPEQPGALQTAGLASGLVVVLRACAGACTRPLGHKVASRLSTAAMPLQVSRLGQLQWTATCQLNSSLHNVAPVLLANSSSQSTGNSCSPCWGGGGGAAKCRQLDHVQMQLLTPEHLVHHDRSPHALQAVHHKGTVQSLQATGATHCILRLHGRVPGTILTLSCMSAGHILPQLSSCGITGQLMVAVPQAPLQRAAVYSILPASGPKGGGTLVLLQVRQQRSLACSSAPSCTSAMLRGLCVLPASSVLVLQQCLMSQQQGWAKPTV